MTATKAPERPETAADTLAATGRQSSGKRATTARSAPTPNGCMRPSRPPTEAEIRDALRRRRDQFPDDRPDRRLRQALDGWFDPLTGPVFVALESADPRDELHPPEAGELWTDLRPSEAIVLRGLAQAAFERAFERCQAVITEEVVSAGLAFGAAHPGAPRAAREEAAS